MFELEKLIVSIVRGLGETAQNGAPLHEPVISEKEERYVVECLRSGLCLVLVMPLSISKIGWHHI